MIAYMDCFSGASGDMIVGACLDAGASLEKLRESLSSLSVGGYSVEAARVKKQGFAATKFDVKLAPDTPKKHRHLKDILRILDESALPTEIKAKATRIFQRLAEAEAQAHGSTLEKVHFHEVGAVDAIVDVVGACLALEQLCVTRLICSPLPTGNGTVMCEHGLMPIPAPGTAALLRGVPLAECEEVGELTTPTGAAILTTLAESFGNLPSMTLKATGYGAGTRDGKSRPNLLRILIGEPATDACADEVEVLEANLDDASPEIIGYALERLMEAGAHDAYCVPTTMKKSRPGMLLTVLCDPGRTGELENVLFAETTTFGVRRHRASRSKLSRHHDSVETPYGIVRIKVGTRDQRVFTASPEYDDCRAAALRHQASLRQVMSAAMREWNRSHSPDSSAPA